MPTHTLLVSDLHDGNAVAHTGRLIQCLQRTSWDRLILAGDTFDTDASISANGWRLLDLLHRWSAAREIVLLPGNHDPSIARVARCLGLGTCYRNHWQDHTAGVLVTHGHQDPFTGEPWDRYLRGYKTPTALGNQVESDLSFYGGRPGRWLALAGHRLRRRLCNVRQQVCDAALDLAARAGLVNVVCGHTHFAESIPATSVGAGYVNLGSWCQSRDTYAIFDGCGKVTLEEFRA